MINLKLSPQEIVGFFVGEGSFTVESGRDPKYILGWRIRPYASVAIRKDDEEILFALKDIIGCGNIYQLDFGRYQKYAEKGWKPQVKWKSSNISDLYEKIVPFFEKWPLFGQKKRAFDIFKQIVRKKYDQHDRTEKGLSEMRDLASQLQLINKRGL